MTRVKHASLALLIVGFCLLATSWLLPQAMLEQIAWDSERGATYTQIDMERHQLMHQRSENPRDATILDKYRQKQQQFEELQQELRAASSTPFWIRASLRVTGIVMLIGGVVMQRVIGSR